MCDFLEYAVEPSYIVFKVPSVCAFHMLWAVVVFV
jgi:hypothetical protein